MVQQPALIYPCKVHFADGEVLEINAIAEPKSNSQLIIYLEGVKGESYSLLMHSIKYIVWGEPVPRQEDNTK
jgi:hypothetical protein